jgi:hypothetical protein
MDNNTLDSITVPTETYMQQAVNYAVSTAIPALITAVDERVGTILGTAVSTMEATANRVEATTQKRAWNPQRSDKRSVTSDEYDGDIEVTPKKPKGPKPSKINKQHVGFHHLIIYSLNNNRSCKELIRKWLADRGVLYTKDQVPIPPTDEEVAVFDIDHAGGPVIGLPMKMHWKSGFSSNWNRQAIFVLVSEFLADRIGYHTHLTKITCHLTIRH